MSSDGSNNTQGGDFWEEEDNRRKMAEHIIESNKLGGYSDKFANLNLDDEDDDDTSKDDDDEPSDDEDSGEST